MRWLIPFLWLGSTIAHGQAFRADLEAGRFLKVLAQTEGPLGASRSSSPIRAARSQALTSLLRLDEALAEADRAVTLDPNLADAYLARGLAKAGQAIRSRNLSSLRGISEAMDDLRRATTLDPSLTRAWMSLGLGYQELPWALGGSTRKALECAAALRKVNPIKGDFLEGLIWNLEGDWGRADACFTRALAAPDPEILAGYLDALDDKPARKALGEGAKNERLVREANRFLPLARRSAQALSAVSDALLNGGQREQAWQVLQIAPRDVDAPSLLGLQRGKVAAKSGLHLEEGLASLDHVLGAPLEGGSGGYAAVHWRRGQILNRLGRAEEARNAARAALQFDPKHPGARRLLEGR